MYDYAPESHRRDPFDIHYDPYEPFERLRSEKRPHWTDDDEGFTMDFALQPRSIYRPEREGSSKKKRKSSKQSRKGKKTSSKTAEESPSKDRDQYGLKPEPKPQPAPVPASSPSLLAQPESVLEEAEA